MALFDISPDINYNFRMQLLKEAANNLKIGDSVSFLSRENKIIIGTVKSFINWYYIEVIANDGGKWGVSADWCEKLNLEN